MALKGKANSPFLSSWTRQTRVPSLARSGGSGDGGLFADLWFSTASDNGGLIPLTGSATVSKAAQLIVDADVFTDGASAATVTRAVTTTQPNSILIAMVAVADRQSSTVTSPQLSWSLVIRETDQEGAVEIWQAWSPNILPSELVTATYAGGASEGMLVVQSYHGSDSSANAVGASASADALTGAATVSVTATRGGSVVVAVGNDWDGASARTLDANSTMIHQWVAGANSYWTQRLTALTTGAGTFPIGTTAPTNHRWNFAAAEIRIPVITADAAGTLAVTGSSTGTVAGGGGGVVADAAGTVAVSGSSTASVSTAAAASGSIAITGSSAATLAIAGSAAGSLTVTGSSAAAITVAASAEGTISITGASSGTTSNTATLDASGTVAVTGSGAGTLQVGATAAGAVAVSGSAAATSSVHAAGSGALAISGSSAGALQVAGAASGAVPITGSSAGTVGSGASLSATGTISVSGSASASVALAGAASGTIAMAGSGTASVSVVASAAGSIGVTGSASGVVGSGAPVIVSASGLIPITGSSTINSSPELIFAVRTVAYFQASRVASTLDQQRTAQASPSRLQAASSASTNTVATQSISRRTN